METRKSSTAAATKSDDANLPVLQSNFGRMLPILMFLLMLPSILSLPQPLNANDVTAGSAIPNKPWVQIYFGWMNRIKRLNLFWTSKYFFLRKIRWGPKISSFFSMLESSSLVSWQPQPWASEMLLMELVFELGNTFGDDRRTKQLGYISWEVRWWFVSSETPAALHIPI